MDDTSAIELEPSDPQERCVMCGGYLISEIEADVDLEANSICGACKFSVLQYMHQNAYVDLDSDTENNGLASAFVEDENFYGEDSDASVDVDSFLNNQGNSDDDEQYEEDEFEEIETNDNTVGTVVGRIQLRRSLATNGRNLSVDWLNEILSHEIDIRNRDRSRVHVPNSYVGNAGDYLEEFLDRLAETTESSRRGARPASVSFVKNLELVVVDDVESDEGLVCVICKDVASVGTVVNRLPCDHIYHPSCIVPWLNERNTCPICRYEVPTDDKDSERRQRGSHETRLQDVEDEEASSEEDEGGYDERGGARWWFVAAPIVGVVGIGLVLWFGGGVFGGSWASQRDKRSSMRWWCPF